MFTVREALKSKHYRPAPFHKKYSLYIRCMTEDFLNSLSIDELFNVMMESTTELEDMINRESETKIEAKRKEVQLIQRFIVAKKAQFRPGFPL